MTKLLRVLGFGVQQRKPPSPLNLPTWPGARGPTHSGLRSWLGLQLLLSSVHGPSSQRDGSRKKGPGRAWLCGAPGQ